MYINCIDEFALLFYSIHLFLFIFLLFTIFYYFFLAEEAAKSVYEDKLEEGTDITLAESALPSDVTVTQ